MPLFYHKMLPKKGELGLWKIEEPETYFLEKLDLSQAEEMQVNSIKGRGRLEWLASRWLLHTLSGRPERSICLKDEFGKPHLTDSPFEISISHSWGIAAVMAAPYSIGIDIQKHVPKIQRIQHKFMREEELASLQTDTHISHLHIYWGAKEALYKAYGRKQLDFKQHILIEPFKFNLGVGISSGSIQKEAYQENFDIYYQKINEYYLVYALKVR